MKRIRRKPALIIGMGSAMFVLAGSAFYHHIVSGGMIARQKPSAFETFVAQGLVDLSIPKEAKTLKNPLAATEQRTWLPDGNSIKKIAKSATVTTAAGRPRPGSGLYPPPLDLSRFRRLEAKTHRRRIVLFHPQRHSQHRHAGLAIAGSTDLATGRLHSQSAHNRFPDAAATPPKFELAASGTAHYVGSAACKTCHAAIYDHWNKTLMANVVRDPREHPDAIIPDLSKPDPLVKFTVDRHRLCLRQQMEAALFQESRRRLFSPARAVGRHS